MRFDRTRVAIAALSATAAARLRLERRRDPDRRHRHALAAPVSGRGGDQAQDQGPDDRAAEPVHGREPELQHPQRHLDDRRLPAQGPARQLAGRDLGGQGAGAVRLDRLRQPGAAGERLPLGDRPAPGADHGPEHAGDDLHLRPAERAQPAEHPRVPELHRRGLLLPRRRGPDLGADEDRPHLRDRPGRRRQHAHPGARLRPHRGARPGDRADHLGAAGLQRADLVRLEEERQGRHPRPRHRAAEGQDPRRGDRELLRGRRGRRSTSSPTGGCTGSRPVAAAARG